MHEISMIRHFGVLYRTFVSYMTKSVQHLDISFSDSVFLVNIGDSPDISQEEIAVNLAIDKAAVARSVKSMAQKSYIIIEKSSDDQRRNSLTLSESGLDLYRQVVKINVNWLNMLIGDLPRGDADPFFRVADALSEKAKLISSKLKDNFKE